MAKIQENPSAKKKEEVPAAPAAAETTAPKRAQEQATLSLDQIVMPKNRKLIVRESTGDIDELRSNIRKNGQLEPVGVRPAGKGKFELLWGQRRFAAMQANKAKSIMVVIRYNLGNDSDALACIISENAGDVRTEPTAIETAIAFSTMRAAYLADGIDESKVNGKIASATGTSGENVRRTLRIVEAPKPLLEMLRKGEVGKELIVKFQQNSDAGIQKKLLKSVTAGEITSANEIATYAMRFAKEAKEGGDEVAAPSDKRKSAVSVTAWRGKREIMDLYNTLWADYDKSTKEGDADTVAARAWCIVGLAYSMGRIDEIDITTKAFKALAKGELSRMEEEFESDNDGVVADAPEKAPAPKAKKTKKAKKDADDAPMIEEAAFTDEEAYA